MKMDLSESVAYTLGGDTSLLPYLDELLAGLDALGTPTEDIVGLVRPLALDGPVLDLGCGRGATLVALARELHLSGKGIDGHAPFVHAATSAAEAAGVAEQCRFECQDLRQAVSEESGYALTLYLAVGDVLGSLDEQVTALRNTLRPGGYMLIDDCFRLNEGPLPLPEYDRLHTRDEALEALLRHGDRLVEEAVYPRERVQAMNAANNRHIAENVERLAARHPDMAEAFRQYFQRQLEECRILENDVADVHWLLQRAS